MAGINYSFALIFCVKKAIPTGANRSTSLTDLSGDIS